MTQLFLETATGLTSGGASTVSFVVMMVAMVALFYFMLIRPQQKQQKKVSNMLNNLKVGDRVKTIGGLYGRVIRIKDEVVFLEVGASKVEMPFSRRAIGSVEDGDVENEL
jgi:preprotein translocase subunit YajC